MPREKRCSFEAASEEYQDRYIFWKESVPATQSPERRESHTYEVSIQSAQWYTANPYCEITSVTLETHTAMSGILETSGSQDRKPAQQQATKISVS